MKSVQVENKTIKKNCTCFIDSYKTKKYNLILLAPHSGQLRL